jgi:putative ABC transport system substrate-binding protein
MIRRHVIMLIGGAPFWAAAARAQVSPRHPLVAWLSGGAQAASSGFVDAFLQGMREQGHIQGRDIDIVYRYADGYAERLPTLAEELVRLKPNVILAPATAQAVAAKMPRRPSRSSRRRLPTRCIWVWWPARLARMGT